MFFIANVIFVRSSWVLPRQLRVIFLFIHEPRIRLDKHSDEQANILFIDVKEKRQVEIAVMTKRETNCHQ